ADEPRIASVTEIWTDTEAVMFKTIVVGVDGRDGGRDALALAGRLALVAGGDIVAVRALPLEYWVTRGGAPAYSAVAADDARADLAADLAAAPPTPPTHLP